MWCLCACCVSSFSTRASESPAAPPAPSHLSRLLFHVWLSCSCRTAGLPLLSVMLGSLLCLQGIVALVLLGKTYHFRVPDMARVCTRAGHCIAMWSCACFHECAPRCSQNAAFANNTHLNFIPLDMLVDALWSSPSSLHHRDHMSLLCVCWVLLCCLGLCHRRIYYAKWFCYSPGACCTRESLRKRFRHKRRTAQSLQDSVLTRTALSAALPANYSVRVRGYASTAAFPLDVFSTVAALCCSVGVVHAGLPDVAHLVVVAFLCTRPFPFERR